MPKSHNGHDTAAAEVIADQPQTDQENGGINATVAKEPLNQWVPLVEFKTGPTNEIPRSSVASAVRA